MKPVSVAALTASIKNTLEINFSSIEVEGEISNFKEHSSGHRYFTLKDSQAQISCTMWKARSLNFLPKDGMKVVVRGSVTVYPQRGNYQIDVFAMSPAGLGDLYLAYEALKQKLAEEGLFDLSLKKVLPRLPMKIGISTSPTGAAVQDMFTTIKRRFPAVEVYFRPTLVQGDGAAEDIVKAISELEALEPDVIIIGRGGGSIEDLWCFNTEQVAYAIAKCKIPLISAVGHETDFTIADFVADQRAATPTAAAELVTPYIYSELQADLNQTILNLNRTVGRLLRQKSEMLVNSIGKYSFRLVSSSINQYKQNLDDYESQMLSNVGNKINIYNMKLESGERLLKSLHPKAPLEKGFAIIRQNGKFLGRNDKLNVSSPFTIERKSETIDAVAIHNTSAKKSNKQPNINDSMNMFE